MTQILFKSTDMQAWEAVIQWQFRLVCELPNGLQSDYLEYLGVGPTANEVRQYYRNVIDKIIKTFVCDIDITDYKISEDLTEIYLKQTGFHRGYIFQINPFAWLHHDTI